MSLLNARSRAAAFFPFCFPRTRSAQPANVGFGSLQVMLGVDRLDMIKGIPQKLLAYEMFLDENPEW